MIQVTPIDLIRNLSGVFTTNNEEMQERLALICLLSRYIIGDVEKEYVNEVMTKIGVELI